MLGRFAGGWLLGRAVSARVLMLAAFGAAASTLAATVVPGASGAGALIAVGLFNAVMYPTICALALPTAADAVPIGSMLLCMAVVGGAVLPVLTGVTADLVGLAPALALPALCYVGIAGFGWSCLSSSRAPGKRSA